MSAAEELKALVEGFFEDTEPSGYEAPVEIIRALPQIVAVVKAAEHLLMGNLEDHFFTDYRKELAVALAALDEGLELRSDRQSG